MPIGAFNTIPYLVRIMLMNKHETVLDLGIGHGINGALVRNWLDSGVRPYKTHLEGVEGFDYRSPLWDCYNLVHECTIEKFFETDNRKWDCIIMTDVIEHFHKLDGVWVITQAKERLNKGGVFIVVTPGVFFEQGAYMGNELEIHRSAWSPIDFQAHGFNVVMDGSLDSLGYKMILAEYVR